MEESREIDKARKEFKKAANSEALSISLYMAINAAEQSEERFKKADEAMKMPKRFKTALMRIQ